MRWLKKIAAFLFCTALVLIMGIWGAALSLSDFHPGGDVTPTRAQHLRANAGDAMLSVFDWPSQHFLSMQRSWVFSSLFYGAVLYATSAALRSFLRKSSD